MSNTINRDEIVTILRLVERSACSQFELTVGDTAVRLRKNFAAPSLSDGAPPAVAAISPLRNAAAEQAQPPPVQASTVGSSKNRELVEGFQVKAPMLGVFYRASSPDSPPFIEVGNHIEVGATLCIIEVMKVMNTVKANRAGVIAAIYPDNGEMVEFGETIIVIGEATG